MESNHFGVSRLAVDDNLRRKGFVIAMSLVARTDTVLQLLDHRTSGVDDRYVALLGNPVGGRRFAVRTEQHARVRRKATEVIVVDGLQTELFETRHLLAVMHYVPQAIKRAFGQLAFRCLDGTCHSKAKTTIGVDSNRHNLKFKIKNDQ